MLEVVVFELDAGGAYTLDPRKGADMVAI